MNVLRMKQRLAFVAPLAVVVGIVALPAAALAWTARRLAVGPNLTRGHRVPGAPPPRPGGPVERRRAGRWLYGDPKDEVFLGGSMRQRNTHMSDETQKVVDEEVKRFVEDGYQTAQKVIRDNIDDLHTIAQALIEFETLTGDEIRGLMEGKTPMRPSDTDPPVKSTGVPSAGKSGKKRPDAEPGAAPEPQPGR